MRLKKANSAPASPARAPAMMKANRRTERTLAPTKETRMLFSRVPLNNNPNGECTTRKSTSTPSATMKSTRK